jgi:hypothetical protein
MRFEDCDLIFSHFCIPLVDNIIIPEEALLAPSDGVARGLAGQRLCDICIYEEWKPDTDFEAPSPHGRRTVAELLFEDGTALALKTGWFEPGIIVVERTDTPKHPEDFKSDEQR